MKDRAQTSDDTASPDKVGPPADAIDVLGGPVDSGFDKEAIKQEVLIQLEREQLKKEILNDLKPSESGFFEFLKHPAVLLILGFILTTLAGGWLTSNWQSREWYNQQLYLARQRELDQKYAITDQLTKAVGQSVTAADDVLAMFYWEGSPKARSTDEKEIREYWRQSSRAWRVDSSSLVPKLAAHFKNRRIIEAFDEIVGKRLLIGNKIKNLLGDLDLSSRTMHTDPGIRARASETLDLDNELREALRTLAATMVTEILEDGTPQPPPSFFQSLRSALPWFW